MTITEKILIYLQKPRTVAELAKHLGIPQARASTKISQLRAQGYIVTKRNVKPLLHQTVKKPKGNATNLILEALKKGPLTVDSAMTFCSGFQKRTIGSTLSLLAKQGKAKIIDRRVKTKNGGRLYLYAYNEDYKKQARGKGVTPTPKKIEIDVELSRQFRLFQPKVGAICALGVWV
ncbi:hypothetical protein AAEX37_01976 [Oligella sp. MSHR50489EDL]|uniref:winged helix-turn-helix domain-containing protein n=1 Tax=Oligella sp. MSHR50489EDL TaxID=3139409 RepID=UPI003D814E7E